MLGNEYGKPLPFYIFTCVWCYKHVVCVLKVNAAVLHCSVDGLIISFSCALRIVPLKSVGYLPSVTARWLVPNYTAWWQGHKLWKTCRMNFHLGRNAFFCCPRYDVTDILAVTKHMLSHYVNSLFFTPHRVSVLLFRLTLRQSWPNKAGLKCPSVRPSKTFLRFQLILE